jgi:hypothetical protein
VGNGVDELARDAEVAELDVTLRVAEDIGRFNVCSSSVL